MKALARTSQLDTRHASSRFFSPSYLPRSLLCFAHTQNIPYHSYWTVYFAMTTRCICTHNTLSSTSPPLLYSSLDEQWTNLVAKKAFKSSFSFMYGKQRFLQPRNLPVSCLSKSVMNPTESTYDRENDTLRTRKLEDQVTQFRMADFELCNCVSIGLAGRGDELVFEAIVRKSGSPLFNSRVVLRQLTGPNAQRRGRRAIEVLKKLARRQFMYQLYATEVYGYIPPSSSGENHSFTLVHGYYGSYSLHYWLLRNDWLPALEAKLALDEDFARRVGDDTTGGPAVSRQLRIIRMLLRDLLIGANYLHTHGLAHTELRLENIHISCIDRHIKVGLLGNAADLCDGDFKDSSFDIEDDRRKQMMIAFDIRCVGFMMSKMVMRELMDPSVFRRVKDFLARESNPSCLREFLLPIINQKSTEASLGLQILDRDWGAGWNLLAQMLATKPSDRISCLDALRHPFLCGPRWPVEPSTGIIRWGLGSTIVRIAEEYIYGSHQQKRLEHFIDLMEKLNPNPNTKSWNALLPGKWRLLYHTGRHIGLTLRQASPAVLITNVNLTFHPAMTAPSNFSMTTDISFNSIVDMDWPHNKLGENGSLHISSSTAVTEGERIYQIGSQLLKNERKEMEEERIFTIPDVSSTTRKIYRNGQWKKVSEFLPKEVLTSLPVVRMSSSDLDINMSLDHMVKDDSFVGQLLQEVRLQVPREVFDITKIVCGTYIDSRLLVLRGVSGSALVFIRTFTQ